jgi:hypothetical protein
MSKPKAGAAPAKPKKPAAKAANAGTTNKVSGSVVKCEVNLNTGEWISPESCATFYIDEDAKFPSIDFEIKTDEPGPYEWSWTIKWVVQSCPQKSGKKRFSPKKAKTYQSSGKHTSDNPKWKADLDSQVIGGDLSVSVKAGTTTFKRKVTILAKEPGETKINSELDSLAGTHADEVRLAKKIFKQESRFHHLYSDEAPLVSFDNGYGLGQATEPVPSYEEVWNWKKHVKYIVETVIAEKRGFAKDYLSKHKPYTDEHLDTETLVYYNGANHHYYVWNVQDKKWVVNDEVVCDPDQSNKGWKVTGLKAEEKTVDKLRKSEDLKPTYTGRCYAEHIKNAN